MLGCRTGSGPAIPAGRGGNNHARGRFATAALLLACVSLGLPAWQPVAALDLAAPDSAAMPAPSGLLNLTLRGIPDEAHEYMLGARSGLDWIIDRYRVKTDKASGIVNDPNDWAAEHEDPRYIVNLIKRVTTVSVETMGIVAGLPELELG